MILKLNVVIQKEENWYVAICVENNVASQGKTTEESLENLKEALELFYQDEELKSEILEVKQTFFTTLEITK
jgi:predicted RNase H-like HicB family nuclease